MQSKCLFSILTRKSHCSFFIKWSYWLTTNQWLQFREKVFPSISQFLAEHDHIDWPPAVIAIQKKYFPTSDLPPHLITLCKKRKNISLSLQTIRFGDWQKLSSDLWSHVCKRRNEIMFFMPIKINDISLFFVPLLALISVAQVGGKFLHKTFISSRGN